MRKSAAYAVAAALAVLVLGASALAAGDFGLSVQQRLARQSRDLFGVGTPLAASSSAQITQQDALANPLHLLTLAKGLGARIVTAGSASPVIDQMALWPTTSTLSGSSPATNRTRRTPDCYGSICHWAPADDRHRHGRL